MAIQSRRDTIVDVANDLFHKQGYNMTSIADIANQIGITKGNLQYHFRSKEDLLVTVINLRFEQMRVVFERMERENIDPMARLKSFVKMVSGEEDGLSNYGCTIGSINAELGKCQRQLQQKALQMFEQFRKNIERAFIQLGSKEAQTKSMHLLSMIQGAALMSYVYRNGELLQRECRIILEWLDDQN